VPMLRNSLIALLLASPLAAQQTPPTPAAPARPAPRAIQIPPAILDTGIFSPLLLPQANDVRRANGAPGKAYWQQRADYTIKATLDTAAKRLTGSVTIIYTNNSPDSLNRVWLQLDQNLFRRGSVGSLLNAEDSRFGGAGFDGGFEIASFTQSSVRVTRGRKTILPGSEQVTPRVDDTMMEALLPKPIGPGQSTAFRMDYSFTIPEHGADRMGRDGALYELAQWYPRMAVYDDVHGWNTLQYLGQGEFYLEYGDFDYQVTVPAGYIVAGTGTLQNPLEVLTATQRARLAAGARSDSVTRVITAAELASGAARPKQDGTLTWKFKAENVRDVAWAASPEYLWDISAWKGIVANAYYRPAAADIWKDAADMSRFSIQEYSSKWLPYPYPQISAIEGPVSGMEYPMVAMEARDDSKEGLYAVVTHEIGHMWYPMVVGSDERRYPWMDEGFNTFINIFSEEGYFKRDDTARRRGEAAFVANNDLQPTAQPIMTYANRFRTGQNLGSLAYVKPAEGLYLLRNKVLPPGLFDRALAEYTRRWAFKHPQPADFFRTIEDVTGRDLDWFWRGWFFTTGVLDQRLMNVRTSVGATGKVQVMATVQNAGQLVMPLELKVGFADGTSKVYPFPVEIWYKGDTYTAIFDVDQQVVSAQLNPDGAFPDINPGNNVWRAAGTP
jgi:hypothetical protein